MKIRTALILTGLMLISANLFAQSRGDDSSRRGPGSEPVTMTRSLTVPVILDGVQVPAGYGLPNQALTFVLEHGVVHAFTTPAVAEEYMRQQIDARTKGGRISANSYPVCDWPQDYSLFNKSSYFTGSANITLSYGSEYTQLDTISWNNSISAVKAACLPYYTVLYACRNFQMWVSSNCADPDSLYIQGGDIYNDLNSFGFNNRTSSIRFE